MAACPRRSRTSDALDAAVARVSEERRTPVDLVDRLRVALQLRPHSMTLAEVAQQLHTTPRTLQRELRATGTSYRIVRDDVSLRRARELLRQRASLADTSYAVGFATVPAFVRAFRRWTGTTPARWRDEPGSTATRCDS